MQRTQRIILYILFLITGAAWILLSASSTNASTFGNISAPQTGFAAPDFTLQTPQGETYTLSEFRGQAVMINLWATWCPPCRAEMPIIEKMYQEYKEQGFIVLAVDAMFQDDPLQIIPFVEERSLTFPILLDETGAVARAYQLQSLPSSFFVNRQGIITEVVIGGPLSEALLRTRIEQILK